MLWVFDEQKENEKEKKKKRVKIKRALLVRVLKEERRKRERESRERERNIRNCKQTKTENVEKIPERQQKNREKWGYKKAKMEKDKMH